MPLLPVGEALSRILADVAPTEIEQTPLGDADGRTLAGDLSARLTQPPFDASAMDGYAVRSADALAGATLRLIGESAAGHAFAGTVATGEAVRIFTGAALPPGADAVLIQEDADELGDAVRVREPAQPGANIRRAGNDFREGQTLLKAGDVLDARAILLAAAMDHATLPVRRKPVVAILSTGDELVAPGEPRRKDQIVGSVSWGVAAMIRTLGGEARTLGTAGDTADALDACLDRIAGADILFTIGGASVGKHDIVRERLSARGLELDFWKIAMRPGKPLMHGRLGAMRVIGAPGNPVAAMICARLFLVPLIHTMLGRRNPLPLKRPAFLTRRIEANGPREHYMRASYRLDEEGRWLVQAMPSQDSSLMAALRAANCLIVRAPHAVAAEAGEPVEVLPLDF